jgi:hypothetical protein
MSNKAAQRREKAPTTSTRNEEKYCHFIIIEQTKNFSNFQSVRQDDRTRFLCVFLLLGVLAAANIFCIVEADFFQPRDDRIACSYNKKKRNNNNNNNNNTYMIHTTTYLSTYTYLPTYYAHTNHRLFPLLLRTTATICSVYV